MYGRAADAREEAAAAAAAAGGGDGGGGSGSRCYDVETCAAAAEAEDGGAGGDRRFGGRDGVDADVGRGEGRVGLLDEGLFEPGSFGRKL